MMREVMPMLWVKNLEETVKFYTETLGFDLAGLIPGTWAIVRSGEAGVIFAVPSASMPFEKAYFTGSLYFYPENVNTVWEKLKDKVIIDYPINDFDYGMREFAIRDNNGYLLQFGQDMEEVKELSKGVTN